MKLKTYILTFFLFIAIYFLSLTFISLLIFKNQMDSAKQQALGEHYFISSSISSDIRNYYDKEDTEGIIKVLEYYEKGYVHNRNSFELLKDNTIIYPFYRNLNAESIEFPKDETRNVSVEKRDAKTFVNVIGELPELDGYYFNYSFDASEFIMIWEQVRQILLMAGIVFSIILGLLLLFTLNKVFSPLEIISSATKKISTGDYSNKILIKDKGELSKVATSFNHMTDEIQKQMLLLSQAATQKQQFIDNLSHELRTPLTSIYGYAEYMKNTNLDDEEKSEAIDFIMNESKNVINISNSLLDLAMYRNQELIYEKIDFRQLVNEVNEMLKFKISEKQIDYSYNLDFDTLYGVRDLVKILILNLVSNSIKNSSVKDKIILNAYETGNKKIITVEDTGKGMKQEEIENVTEPFYKADKSRSRKGGGIGLGLTICKQICDSHNANMEFESEYGEGTKVKISFTTS